ncbi:MAG: SdpI family protein [Corynebacterium sp.]|uniref:SdpI family protein n=1 Tax=Corynebacterium sp. TaxID=1720 RepID=UPI0026DC80D0|nr:SdpI family protein [Corynebacterium sp.]MDO5030228.1 SdpI family protein [Corynebacterium sp.]
MIVIPVITLVLAICVAVVAGLAWSAKLPGNNWIGIRAPEARKSQENWDITHRVAGPPWAVSAIAFLGAAMLGFLAIRPEASGWLWLWFAVAVLGGIAMLGVGAAMGSHTIALYDAKVSAESDSGCGCGDGDSGCGCGDAPAAETNTCASDDPAAECGVAGGCSSCGLEGLCTDKGDAAPANTSFKPVDKEALRKAAEQQGHK